MASEEDQAVIAFLTELAKISEENQSKAELLSGETHRLLRELISETRDARRVLSDFHHSFRIALSDSHTTFPVGSSNTPPDPSQDYVPREVFVATMDVLADHLLPDLSNLVNKKLGQA